MIAVKTDMKTCIRIKNSRWNDITACSDVHETEHCSCKWKV